MVIESLNSTTILKTEVQTIGRKPTSEVENPLQPTSIPKTPLQLQHTKKQNEFPIPDKVNMEVIYTPSKTVSGDFYHLERMNDNLVIGAIWDVSGKGVTAALSISAFNVLFNRAVWITRDPLEILNYLNSRVPELLGDTYVAACCFSLDFEKKEAKIAGAGLNQFMYCPKEGNYQEKVVKGPFLGMFEDSIFDQEIINFKAGDKFCFLTDGLEFVFDDDKIKDDYLKTAKLSEFKDYVYKAVSNDYNLNNPIKPTVMGEPSYEGIMPGKPTRGIDMRRQAFQSFFAGAAGFTYGGKFDEEGNGPLWSPFHGWKKMLDMEGAKTMRYVKLFCMNQNWPNWTPDNSILAGEEEKGALQPVAVRNNFVNEFYIYFPENRSISVDLSKEKMVNISVQWFNPYSGDYTAKDRMETLNAPFEIKPPEAWLDALCILRIEM